MLKMKKLLAVLIAFVLAFSCFAVIPMTVSAADAVYYAKLDYASKETWSYLQTELPLEAGTYQFDVDYRIDGTVLPAVGLAEATEVSSTYENNHITVQFTCEGQMRLRLKPNSWDLKGVIYFANPVLRKVEDGAVTGENLVWDFSKQYTEVGSTITTDYGWKGKWQRVNESASATFTVAADTINLFTEEQYYAKLDYASKETWSYLQTELPLEAGTYQFDVDYRVEGDGGVLPAVGLAEATEVSSTYENNHITVQFTCEGQMRLRLKPNSWDLKGVIYFANPVLRKVENGSATGRNCVWDFSQQAALVGSTITTAYAWNGKWQKVGDSASATFTVAADTINLFTEEQYYAKLDYSSKNTWTYLQTELPLDAGTYQLDVDYRADGSVTPAVNLKDATKVSAIDENNHLTVQFTWNGGTTQVHLKDSAFSGTGVIYFANPVLRKVENGSATGRNYVWDFSQQSALVGSDVTTAWGYRGKWYKNNTAANVTVAADTINLFSDELYFAKLNYSASDSSTYLQTELPLDAGTYQIDVDYRTEGNVTARVNVPDATINSTTNENGHITIQLTWSGNGNFQVQLRDNTFSGTGIIYFANPVLRKVENGSAIGRNYVWDFSQQSALIGSTITTTWGWRGKWYKNNNAATITVEADANGLFDEPVVEMIPLYEAVDADGNSLSGDEGFQTFAEALDAVTDGGAIIALDDNTLKSITLSKKASYTIYGSFEDAGTIAIEGGVTINAGDVTFENVTCDGIISINNNASLTINGGNYTNNSGHMIQIQDGDLTIDGDASFEYTNTWASMLRVLNNGRSDITINSGTFTGESHNTMFYYTENTTGTFTINGGTFTDTTPSSESAWGGIIRTVPKNNDGRAASAANIVINGGTFNLSRPAPAISHEGTGSLSIKNATSTNTYGPVLNVDSDCDVTIENCTFTSSNGGSDTVLLNGSGVTSFKNSTITSPEGKNAVLFDANNMPDVIGLNNSFNGLNYLGDLIPVCRIDDKNYSSFEAAIAAVEDGQTIVLLADLGVSTDFNSNKTYTIDANGFKFNTDVKVSAGTVTLKNVTQELPSGSNDNILVTNGNLIIDGGSYKHAKDGGVIVGVRGNGNVTITGDAVLDKSSNESGHCIQAESTATGTITIDSATVKNAKWSRAVEAEGTQNIVITPNAKIVANTAYGSPLIRLTNGTVSLTNQNITIGNNTIILAPGAEVILSGCKLTSDASAIRFDSNSVLTVTSSTTIESKKNLAFKDNIKGTINGEEYLTVIDAADPTDGMPRILRLAGDKNGSWGGYAQWVKLEANSTYTYSFDYRATGGIKLWNSLSMENITKSNEVLTDTHYTVTLTTADSPSCTIILGEKSDATGGTLYLTNISMVKEGDSTNLVKNGDFATNDLSNWNPQNNPSACFESIEFVKPDDSINFFDDASVEAASSDYAVALKGGSWKVYKFTAFLEANTSYSFSYDYRSVGDTLKFYITDGVTLTENTDGTDKFTKNYTITNGSTAQKVDFKFGTEEDTTGDIMYLSNLKLYKLNGDVATGVNMIADLNPVYPVYYASLVNEGNEIEFNTADNKEYTNKVGFGWLCTDSTVNLSVVKLPDDFFTKYSNAELIVALRKFLINEVSLSTINPYYDVNLDGVVNIIDLVRAKKMLVGAFGGDYAAELLKTEIMNAANTDVSAITGKVVYVDSSASSNGNGTENSPYNSITTANNNVSSGDAVLLKRGSVFRGSYTFNSGVTYGSYGEGAKPEILGSTKDWKQATWTNVGGNIWSVSYGSSTRLGNVYLFKGDDINTPAVMGRGIDNTSDSYFDSNADLVKEGDFRFANRTIYLYSEGNPSTTYSRIEIASGETAITLSDGVTVNNIAVKYAGNHGIASSNNDNITISYCEIGYIGGTESEGAPLGNGIQFGLGGSNIVADHNYVYQCYDAGITPQIWESYKADDFNGVTISNNLLTNNFYNLEVWADGNSKLQNIVITNNVLNNAGYCWSWDQRFETVGNGQFLSSHIYGSRDTLNTSVNNSIIITGNTFNNARALQVAWYWDNEGVETFPGLTAEGNTYFQSKGSLNSGLMLYGNTDPTKILVGKSQDTFETAVKTFDSNPKLVYWFVTQK